MSLKCPSSPEESRIFEKEFRECFYENLVLNRDLLEVFLKGRLQLEERFLSWLKDYFGGKSRFKETTAEAIDFYREYLTKMPFSQDFAKERLFVHDVNNAFIPLLGDLELLVAYIEARNNPEVLDMLKLLIAAIKKMAFIFNPSPDFVALRQQVLILSSGVVFPEDFGLRGLSLDRQKLLERILWNLINNAIRAGACAVTVTAQKENEFLTCSVSDDGRGFSAGTWIPEAEEEIRRKGHGFGLLSSLQECTKAGGSLVGVSAGEGKGSTFTVRLPIDVTGEVVAEGESVVREVSAALNE